MNKLPIQDILSDNHLQAIGLVIAEWAWFENALLYMLVEVVTPGKPKTYGEFTPALTLATGMGYQTMLGLIETHVAINVPQKLKYFQKEIIEPIKEVAKRRDLMAHAAWKDGPQKGTVTALRFKSVKKIKTEFSHFKADQIRAIAHKISRMKFELHKFLTENGMQKENIKDLPLSSS